MSVQIEKKVMDTSLLSITSYYLFVLSFSICWEFSPTEIWDQAVFQAQGKARQHQNWIAIAWNFSSLVVLFRCYLQARNYFSLLKVFFKRKKKWSTGCWIVFGECLLCARGRVCVCLKPHQQFWTNSVHWDSIPSWCGLESYNLCHARPGLYRPFCSAFL